MKQMKTRLTALVLALTMMLSCSVSVFAANDPDKYNIEYELPYTGDSDDDRVDLEELIYHELAYEFDWDNDVELKYYEIWTDDSDYEVYDEDLDYGKINSKDIYIAELTDSDEDDLYEAGAVIAFLCNVRSFPSGPIASNQRFERCNGAFLSKKHYFFRFSS